MTVLCVECAHETELPYTEVIPAGDIKTIAQEAKDSYPVKK
jgi:hypothetical protein